MEYMKIDGIPKSISEGIQACYANLESFLDMLVKRIVSCAGACFGYSDEVDEEIDPKNTRMAFIAGPDAMLIRLQSERPQEISSEINDRICKMTFQENALVVTFPETHKTDTATLTNFANLILKTFAEQQLVDQLEIKITRDTDYHTLTSRCKIGKFDGKICNQLMDRVIREYTIAVDRSELPPTDQIQLYSF